MKQPADTKRLAKDEALISAHLRAIRGAYPEALKHTNAGREILAGDADRRASIVARALEIWPKSFESRVASELLRANTKDWTTARLVRAVEAAAVIRRDTMDFYHFDRFPHKPLISAVENAVARESLSPELRAALERWKAAVSPRELTPAEERELGEAEVITEEDDDQRPWKEVSKAYETFERLERIRRPLKEERKLIERLSFLLSKAGAGRKRAEQPKLHLNASDAVGTLMAGDVAAGKRASGPAWAALLNHARTLTATTPSRKWSDEAAKLAAKIPPDKFGSCVSDWLNEAGKPARKPLTLNYVTDATLLNDCTVDLLKGLAWTIVAAKRADLATALGNLAEACFKKIPNKGPRNVKVANAATAALAALADPAAAAQLSRLRLRVKHHSSRAAVDKALNTASEKTGLSPDDLAEISVPAFGLDRRGTRQTECGDYRAELRVANAREVDLRWFTPDGKQCASVPGIIRTKHADDLKRLKREAKDASIMLAAQALRLERSFISERNWPLKVWRERFLDHPLVGTLARRVIWQFDDRPAIPHQSELLSAADRPISSHAKTAVSLWHPLRSTPEQVLAWRNWLERHEVTQPFKQAHREIYVLTDAERRTDTYSNRFAAHILRQHQLAALCQSRGWDYRLQGQFDSHNVPTLTLPAQNLKAEFWVEAVASDATPRGIFLYAASDQVRFGRRLDQVPPVVFSEVMRDVDLFVGVASVASDPTWQDSGPEGRYRAYWNKWSFGDLSERGRNRKTILERLLPRLADAKRFALKDKFLIVRGKLRTYKIHLGSGNILMEPNDQYLCIVAAHSRDSGPKNLWLPFEGDATLSVILSKAVMLAADHQITDQTITRQINS
jgi:Domain of unknown function (DUF4132)